MKPFRLMIGVGALGMLAAAAGPAHGAWNNVFQVTCFRCNRPATSAYVSVPAYSVPVTAAADPCCPPPQPVCTTRYVQRCYYQPVTTYQTKTYYEPVTTYRTSYFYEPVTSYRYSCYFDPCTCRYQKVACPTTSYQLRSQCCPVQSWVQRCCSVPVTTYQQCSYWEPVTTCCTPAPTPCCPATPAPCCTPTATAAAPAPTAPVTSGAYSSPVAPPPGVTEQRQTAPPPVIDEKKNGSGSPLYDRYYGPTQPTPMPPASYRQPPGAPVHPVSPVPPPPPVKLERIVVGPDARVEGRVVRSDNSPRPNAELIFVSADRLAPRQVVTANSAGRFRVTLAAGGWMVFINGPDGTPTFHSRIEIGDHQTPQVTLVSR
jgi:hypothetical protein